MELSPKDYMRLTGHPKPSRLWLAIAPVLYG